MDDGKLSPANLPDDLIVEILSRLPVRPLCRCKCVSRAWRDLISHTDHRRRLVQTVSGFFYHLHVDASCPPVPYWRFAASCPPPPGAPGSAPPAVDDPGFPFLPSTYSRTDTELLDSCSGLLLLRCCRASASSSSSQQPPAPSSCFYVVCNPATGKWVELPEPIHAPGTFGLRSEYLQGRRRTRLAALAFDPDVSSSRFHVLQLVEREEYYPFLFQYRFVVEAVEIYSSETKRWALSDGAECEWRGQQATCTGQQATYHDGSLHFAVDDGGVMSVGTNGHAWRVTRVFPENHVTLGGGGGGGSGFIGRSQGRLLYVHKGSRYASLSVYALERIWGAKRWTLQHYASALDQFGQTLFKEHYGIVAVHPDGNVIFLFDSCRGMLMVYDMDRRTVRDIHPLAEASRYYPFFPYVPLYSSEALSGS